MKLPHRLLCLLLLLMFVTVAFTACRESDITESVGSETSEQETTNTDFRLKKKNFGNVTLKVLSADNYQYQACEIAPTELNTEPVNDAAYNRATLLEQEYGITLEQVFVVNTHGLYGITSALREAVTTGTDTYQLVCAPLHYLAILCGEDAYYDLSNIESNQYIDLHQPYWDQSAIKNLSLMNRVYFLNGDAIVSDDEATWAVFFNKDIAEDNHLAETYGASTLYELVSDGKWTIDVMHSMAKTVALDVDGGGMSWSPDTQDIWGINSQVYDGYAFNASSGHTMTRLENGLPVITIGEEANVKSFEKVFNILSDKQTVALAEVNGSSSPTKYDDLIEVFANGKALFMPEKIGTVSTAVMRNADIRYSLLPMPKLDETQESYATTTTVWWCSVLAIPVTNVENFDATCYALEALAYYGQQDLTPEYYDRTLKYKRFPDDEEATEMLDLIFRNRSYDIGAVMNFGDDMLYFYDQMLIENSNTHISKLDANRDRYQEAIDEFVETLA